MGIQYATVFTAFTVVTANPVEDTSYPKTRMSDREFPLREARSTGSVEQDYVFDFASALASQTYYLGVFGANYTSVKFAHGDVASPTTDVSFTPETTHTLGKDNFNGRYKGFFSKTLSKRYLRMRIPSQTRTDGAGVYKSAIVTVSAAITTLTQDPLLPLRLTKRQLAYGAASARKARSPIFLDLQWDAKPKAADLNEWRTLALLDPDATFVAYLNRGNTEEVYLLRNEGDAEYDLSGPVTGVTLRFPEYVGPLTGRV